MAEVHLDSMLSQFVPKRTVRSPARNADDLDPAGVYVGTTTGQLFWSADAGRNWSLVPYQFPGIHSVAVGTRT